MSRFRTLSTGTTLFCLILSFAFGIAAASFGSGGSAFAMFVALVGLALLLYGAVLAETRNAFVILFSLCLLGAASGMLRFALTSHDDELGAFVGRTLVFEGVVVDEPDIRERSVRLSVLPRLVGEVPGDFSEKVLVVLPYGGEYSYGDRVRFIGTLHYPRNFENALGRTFNYVAYLAKDGIHYQMFHPKTERIGQGEGSAVKAGLFRIKNAFMRSLGQLIPEPESSLAGGLIVGAKQSLGKEWIDTFRIAGVIHIVVLSGYNITIVADSVMSFLGLFFARGITMFFGAVSIILFAVMTGGSATVVRASIMTLLVVLARGLGRRYDVTRALLLAGFLMILQNPHILVFDPSFQLSFLATVGLIYVSPVIEPYFSFITDRFKLREIAVSTFATQLFVLPMILYMTGLLSLVSPIVNLLVLPLIPLTMLFGFLAGTVGIVSGILAWPAAFLAHLLLGYELAVSKWFAGLPFAAVSITYFPALFMAALYALYGVVLWRLYRRRHSLTVSQEERSVMTTEITKPTRRKAEENESVVL